ncbi:hypothetical protein TRFO_34554 [Tritrichomonas foetus]|uniref:Uncharacterized protein n=1 Tax=Tritrichomonas foetus TaxID=1144522 RepID=A0A1J4JKF9_9EUKA|nr:hypothetical protein TRFO_34554 [Tritrichomonas foetus]|eukprot:OHS99105.1 hypothetical protein TRFO_34554 [Tritrichomonas foetus]
MNLPTPQDAVRDFFDWRYHAREFYENVSMHVLPEHPISLNFTNQTIKAQDSYVYGLILGNYNSKSNSSSVSLYNVSFPNRTSISFDKSKPNPEWGRISNTSKFSFKGRIYACNLNSSNDIMAAVDNDLIYISETSDTKIALKNDQAKIIQFLPGDSSMESFLCTRSNSVMFYKGPKCIGSLPFQISKFKRSILDLSIDPYNPQTALVCHGKVSINCIDIRDSSRTSIKLEDHVSSLAFANHIPFMFAAGSLSGVIAFFDIRLPSAPICTITAHDSEVTSLKWSVTSRDIVASSSLDAAVALWSLNEAKEADPSAVFAHNGHVTPITAFDWCQDMPWTMASVSEDNLFEIWTIAPSQIEDYLYP